MEDLRWIKFWPADWQRDPAVRMCGLAARGLWIEMICVMHEAEPYGHLLVNGRAPTDRQMAALFGVTDKEVKAMIAELEEAGVFSRTDSGVIYSRRMVKDEAKRVEGRVNGKRGGNPSLRAGRLTGGDNQQDGEIEHGGLTGGDNPSPRVRERSPARPGLEAEAEAEAEAERNHPKSLPADAARDLKDDNLGVDGRPPGWRGRWKGLRANGSNPRETGENPRAKGTNPRAVAEAVSATTNALKLAEIRRKTEAHALWQPTRPWLVEADFRGFIEKCEFREAGATGSATLIAPSKFVADHVRGQWGDRLRDAIGAPITIDVRAEAVA